MRSRIITGLLCLFFSLRTVDFAPANVVLPQDNVVLNEDFELGTLDSRISVSTIGAFKSGPGIKTIPNFGSTKAFGFGLSTCLFNCFLDHVTTLRIALPTPTFISNISFKEMELFSNWGSQGYLFIDGVRLTGDPLGDFGKYVNDFQPDTTFRSRSFAINRAVKIIELRVEDITNLSEIYIDDLVITGADIPQICVPPPPDMVSWWPGDGDANDIVDSNQGTPQNGATFAAGMVGQAFTLDGIDDFVNVPDAVNLRFGPTSPMTVDLWAFRTVANPVMHFIGKRLLQCGGGVEGTYQMALNTASGKGLVFNATGGGGVATGMDLPLNTWTHLAGTFDGTTFRFYINGALVASAAGNLGPTNTAPLKIGGSGNCATFGGLLDEVEIFNRALSASEIQAIYNAGSAGKCKPTAGADLAVTKSGSPDPACVNGNIVYTLNFIDNGPGPGLSTTVTDAVPANTTFVSAAVSTGTGWSVSTPPVGGTGNVVFSKASVAVGETAVFQIAVNVSSGTLHGTVIDNSATAASTVSDPTPDNNTGTTTTTVDPIPPVITCPANMTAKTPQAGNPCVVVTYPQPVVTDNCSGATVVCTPPSGSCFALGTTVVTCVATDTSGNTAQCTFTVTVFDICVQDDSNANSTVLVNSGTGDYRLCCNGETFTGRGKMTIKGSTYTLEHNPADRRVLVKDDEAVHKGTASLQAPPGTIRCTITDRDTQNNTCVCQ